jgi:hypothetical protein
MITGVGPEMERQFQCRLEQSWSQLMVEGDTNTSHELATQSFQQTIEAIEQQGE